MLHIKISLLIAEDFPHYQYFIFVFQIRQLEDNSSLMEGKADIPIPMASRNVEYKYCLVRRSDWKQTSEGLKDNRHRTLKVDKSAIQPGGRHSYMLYGTVNVDIFTGINFMNLRK